MRLQRDIIEVANVVRKNVKNGIGCGLELKTTDNAVVLPNFH
jgi:hypothetical protein